MGAYNRLKTNTLCYSPGWNTHWLSEMTWYFFSLSNLKVFLWRTIVQSTNSKHWNKSYQLWVKNMRYIIEKKITWTTNKEYSQWPSWMEFPWWLWKQNNNRLQNIYFLFISLMSLPRYYNCAWFVLQLSIWIDHKLKFSEYHSHTLNYFLQDRTTFFFD